MDKRSYYQQVFIVIGEAKSNLSISDYEELLQDVESSVNSQLGELLSMDTEEYDEDLDLGEEDEDTDLDVFDTPEQEEYDDREDDTRYDGITATDIGFRKPPVPCDPPMGNKHTEIPIIKLPEQKH